MLFQSTLVAVAACLRFTAADSAGYVLPSSGVASTTQFYLGPELSGGTACGASALPNGKSTSGAQGGGPGYLYVRVTLQISRNYFQSSLYLTNLTGSHKPTSIWSQPICLRRRRPRGCLWNLLRDNTRLGFGPGAQCQRPDLPNH